MLPREPWGAAEGGGRRADRKETKRKGGGGGGLGFKPKGDSATLWATEPKRRRIDPTGMLTGQEDVLIAVARGMRPGGIWKAAEHRATIRGGIAVLKLAGVKGWEKARPEKLKSGVKVKKDADRELVAAAGRKGAKLGDAAAHIRSVVAKERLGKPAFAARGLYILENTKNFRTAHGLTAGVLAVLFPPAGALAAGHIGISGAVQKKATEKFQSELKAGLAEYAAKRQAAEAAEGATAPPTDLVPVSATTAAPAPARPWLKWVLGGFAFLGVVLGGLAIARRPARQPEPVRRAA
jgi:hypothetical protein